MKMGALGGVPNRGTPSIRRLVRDGAGAFVCTYLHFSFFRVRHRGHVFERVDLLDKMKMSAHERTTLHPDPFFELTEYRGTVLCTGASRWA